MPFAVKIQACNGVPGHVGPDYRGGEPGDTHATVRLPGMSHGLEIDPIDDSELPVWLEVATRFNKAMDEFTGSFPINLEMRIMDSDGRV